MRKLCSASFRTYLVYLQTLEVENYSIASILVWVHEELGRAGLCSGEDGAFLKAMSRFFVDTRDDDFRDSVFQCFRCIHGSIVKLSSDSISKEHENTTAEPFGTESALELYAHIKPFLFEKLVGNSFRQITNDMRQCLDMVIKVFPDIPMEFERVKNNHAAIQELLSSDINLHLASPEATQPLYVFDLFGSNEKILPVLFELSYIEAKICFGHYMSRNDKDQKLLSSAIDNFIYHLCLRPYDFDAWLSLAHCYTVKITDALTLGPIEGTREKRKIIDLQKRAFHCFIRASKLLQRREFTGLLGIKSKQVETMWTLFGNICILIASQPMSGEALKIDAPICVASLFNDSGKAKQSIPQSCQYVRAIAVFAYKKALAVDSGQWESHYILANLYHKLGKSPQVRWL